MKYKHRMGESIPVPFRTERVFNANGNWFFSVRDELEQGPYHNVTDLKSALTVYISDKINFNLK